MKVHSEQFHPMLGHVAEGCVIVAPSGREFTLRHGSGGWIMHGPDGRPCSGWLPSANDVTRFVVSGLQSH